MRRTLLLASRPNAYFYAATLRSQPRWHYQFAGALFLFSAASATYCYDQKPKKINPVILDYDYEQNPKKIDIKISDDILLLIEQYCKVSGINIKEMKNLISNIEAACNYGIGSDETKRTVDKIIKQGGSLVEIASLTKDEAIAFFTLAPFGVSPEAFSQHKKLFIQKKEIFFLGFPIVLDITTSAALGACEALLKSGVVFDAAIKDIVEIKRRHQNSNYCLRLNAISHGLSTHYAMTFSDLQISLFNFPSFDSPGLPLTGDQIAALKVANNCDWFALWCVLRYLLATKQESWANTVRIINGEDLKTKSPAFFSVGNTVPNADYINNVLYSRIFRDQAKKELNLSAAFLGDDCVWFNGDADVKALTKMIRENGFDVATAIKQLSALNGHQKWVIVVGGNIDEAKQMYADKDHADMKRIPFSEDNVQKDLEVFRKDSSEKNASAPGL